MGFIRRYDIEKLISGHLVGFPGKTLIAVPDMYEGESLQVIYKAQAMVIDKVGEGALTWRIFPDKFGRDKSYKLIYYEWESAQGKLF